MKDWTTKELLDKLEETKNLLEDTLYLFTTGSKEVNMKTVDRYMKQMKPIMKELRKRGMGCRNDRKTY